MRARLLPWLFGLILPCLALAQDKLVDFAGTITSSTVVPGSLVPSGYTVPPSFTGSFLYDPAATTSAGLITDVTLNVGSTIFIQKNFTGCVCVSLVSSTQLEFADTGSVGFTGPLGPLGLQAFTITFSNPTNGLPIDAHNVDFTGFGSASVFFDAPGTVLSDGRIAASGDITKVSVSVPEPGPFSLMLAALVGLALIRLRFNRASL